MKKSEKRVLIAKDVIAGLREERLRAQTGKYVFSLEPIFNYTDPNDVELKTCLSNVKGCDVCAYGAIFVANVERFNELKIGGLRECWAESTHSIGPASFEKYMLKTFSKTQLRLIEIAFEKSYHDQVRKAIAAVNFGLKYRRAEKRMIAIMKNIIENNGTFKP